MNIGFDAKRAYFNRSGLGNYSRFIIDALARFEPKNDYFLFVPKKGSSVFSAEVYNNCQAVFPSRPVDKLFSSYWRTYSSSRHASRLGMDIFHGLSGEIPHHISRRGIKSVVTIHDLIFLRYPELYKPADRKIYEIKAKYACEHADIIVAISKQTKADIIKYFGIDEARIKLNYQGCSHRFYAEVSNEVKKLVTDKYNLPNKYLLYVGTIEQRKNLLSIVKAIHRSKIEIPLVVVGRETAYLQKVLHYINRHKLKQIHFLKQVEDRELPALYQMSEVFIYPSVFEGFGIPVLEALYSKIPVITNKDGCFREAGGPSSLYVDPLKPEEIAEAIRKVTSDKDFREDVVHDGYKHAQKFNPEAVAGGLMEIYNSI